MYNLHFSGSTNNFRVKVKPQNNNSIPKNKNYIPQNNKQNQYLENRKNHKSPTHTLNKSQNISGGQKMFKVNIKNKINNNNAKHINAKKIDPLRGFKNFILINKNKNKNPSKINPIYKDNLNISKNNSLSNYLNKTLKKNTHNFRRNNTNSNILSMQNNTNYNTTNYNINNNNNIYKNKSNLYNLKKNYLTTDDFINNKEINNNRNSSLYPLVITEESHKKIINNEKNKSNIKKTGSASNTFIKKNHTSIKKLKTNSTSILNKKTNYINNKNIINNNQNKSKINSNMVGNPISSSGGFIENLSTEKTSGCVNMDNFEVKIMNEIKELKNSNFNNNEIINKLKILFEESIENIVPKEYQNIFLLLLKEIFNINNEYFNNIENLKNIIEQLKIKVNNYEKKYSDMIDKFNKKEKELLNLKKEIEKFNKEKIKYNKKKSSNDIIINKDNSYFKNLNAKNINDLDALYFFDKIEYKQNDEKDIPKLNLEQKYIEKCIQKEIIKRNEANLTPFQKIALQFEMSDT